MGSDTIQDVSNQFSNTITINGTKVLGSYDATGSSTIQTKDTTVAATSKCGAIARPNGSGAGRNALLASLNAGDNCIQYSRSSALNQATTPAGQQLTYVPFAKDAVSYAVTRTSNVSRTLTVAQLQAIYQQTTGACAVFGILPQAGSGTRSYWEGQMGIADADVNNGKYVCVINGVKNGQVIEEHNGTFVDDNSVAPFSIPQYLDQSAGLISDKRGETVLGSIAGVAAANTNSAFPITRDVYNVVPTTKLTTAGTEENQVFNGPNSAICQDTADILKFGFILEGTATPCGSTTLTTGQ